MEDIGSFIESIGVGFKLIERNKNYCGALSNKEGWKSDPNFRVGGEDGVCVCWGVVGGKYRK